TKSVRDWSSDVWSFDLDLDSDFNEVAGQSGFLTQQVRKALLKFGQTGDWVELVTNLTDTFTIPASPVKASYSMQLSEIVSGARKVRRAVGRGSGYVFDV